MPRDADDAGGGGGGVGGLCLEWKHLNYYVPAQEQSNYSFWNECRKKRELRILNDVSGHLKTGDLIAIVGGSGVGKTTLLAAISQRLRGNLTGDVVLNGMAMNRDQMTRISSFLPQFEINVKTFTAYEHLYFMSHFKMHRRTTKAEKRQRVTDLLLAVGLRDAAHTRIQQLSGGERKRLSLAEELITDPIFLFCDEPTTGLDSFSAYTVIKTLRHLCTRKRISKHSLTQVYGEDSFGSDESHNGSNSFEMEIMMDNKSKESLLLPEAMKDLPTLDMFNRSPNGTTKKAAICSIHQPTSDIFELFTHIILMDAGRIVYQGRTEQAAKFFTDLGFELPLNCNPADYYVKTLVDSKGAESAGELLRAKYEHETDGLYSGSWLLPKHYSGDYLKHVQNFRKIRWIYQVYLLIVRFMTEDLRNIKTGLIGFGFFMITAATLSLLYSGVGGLTQRTVQDVGGSIFMLSNEMIFTFSYGVTYIFPAALPIIRREVGEGTYSLSAYYVALVVSFIPVAFFKGYVFLSVIYASIYYTRGFLLYITMGFLMSLSATAAVGYGIFLSSLFETDKMASECAAPFDLIFLIFGGTYMNVDSVPLLKYFSLFFYSNEALMYNFWIDIDNIDCPVNEDHPCVKTGLEVLQQASFRTADNTYWLDCVSLLMVALVFHIVSFTLVRRYINRSGYY
ncbi:protein brown [Drosophila grimshawi]|uniref:GH20650 n=1 Tax=Drosophila grimshawi TaxID=7222 RepID=B4J7F5_DROGR|nr:protein brown [Drosophila grimshawi]EDW01079.1 GH20650 [Drosophila grimshawi]